MKTNKMGLCFKNRRFLLIGILSLFFTHTVFGQHILPDSGFNNITEAKNKKVNGVKEGKWVTRLNQYHLITNDTNSAFYRLTVYKAGKPNGIEKEFYKGGQLLSATPYRYGKKNGLAKYYYQYFPNGTLEYEIPFKNGKINGVDRWYYESGELERETPYFNGKENGIEKDYYDSGKLRAEYPYVNGNINGTVKYYYKSGKLSEESIYSYGNQIGTAKGYYESGALKSEATYANGMGNGMFIEYYENGTIESKVHYTNGYENGIYRSYYENDNPHGETKYEMGKTIDTARWYFESGGISMEFPYSNGQLNGLMKDYYKNGKIESETLYKDGRRIRIVKHYEKDGSESKLNDFIKRYSQWIVKNCHDSLKLFKGDTIKLGTNGFSLDEINMSFDSNSFVCMQEGKIDTVEDENGNQVVVKNSIVFTSGDWDLDTASNTLTICPEKKKYPPLIYSILNIDWEDVELIKRN
ncbi:MAG TPA: toxin-antitoxin system YwqK family antitoxin [Bacteroidia bacterium]|nr:toxin-antitoxin system YwqK family antitoxin [Bacteroidia bacterium]